MSALPERARTVIIGGGIMGVSTLYGLAANGWRDVLLCEKAELTSGSTWHAAGQIAHAVGSRNLGFINRSSIEIYKHVQAETGHDVGWHPCGGFRVAYDTVEVDWLRAMLNTGRLLDLPMQLVGPEQVKLGNPFYNTCGIKAAIQTFEDGHIDPSGATQAMAAAARALGASIERRNRVTGATRTADGWLVHTENGDVRTEHVVIAAGSYANQVGRWFGLRIPAASVLHHYLVTDAVPALAGREQELPVMRDNSFGGYIRQEQKSGLIGIYESSNAPVVWTDGVPWEAENELFDADYDAIGQYLERAVDRMPVLGTVGIKRVVRGAITHTPDGGMLVGPAPGERNLWLACGASIGIAWGGGAGKCLADLMVHGEAEISMRGMDPRRFGDFATDEYILVKSREDFEIRHDTPVPGLQRPAGRPWQRTALYDRLAAKGAVFGEVQGFERPRWFAEHAGAVDCNGWRRQPWHAAVADECRGVRETAGLIDLSAFAQFEISGRDAAALLDRLSANRLPGSGRVRLAHFLTANGLFETEATLTRLDSDRFFLGSAIAGHYKDRDWLQRHVEDGEQVQIRDLSSEWGMLALSGPAARDILSAGGNADLRSEAFPWLSGRAMEIFGARMLVLRVSFTGELGYELHGPMESIAMVFDALHAAGAAHGLVDFGSHALNSLRMEKAYRGSAELSPDVGMAEADMLRFFHSEGRDFIGRQATLARLESGPRWHLRYMQVDAADADCIGGEAILHADRVVGMTTSGAFGHHSGCSLAFGYVNSGVAAGVDLRVQILGEEYRATVLHEPVHDPRGARLQL